MQQEFKQGLSVIASNILEKETSLRANREGLQLDECQQHSQPGYEEYLSETAEALLSKRHQPKGRFVQIKWHLSLMIGDGVLLIGLLILLLLLAPFFHLEWQIFRHELVWKTTIPCIALAIMLWSTATRVTQAYESLSTSNRFISAFKVLFALIVTLLLWMLLASPLLNVDISSSFKYVLLFFTIAAPILGMWRVIFAEIKNLPFFCRQAVIIGTTSAAEIIAKELRNAKRPYIKLLGYISENGNTRLTEDGIPFLGSREILPRLVQSGVIDVIISAVDYHVDATLFQETIEMSQCDISVIPMPIAYENVSGKIPVEYIGDQWYLSLPLEVVVSPLYLLWHKLLDITCGLIGTALLLLIMPVIALLIRLDSQGPIFYSQERLGINGKPFRIYKFRSMRVGAERSGKAQWAKKDDMRVTKIGRFMRISHLDELPQVWNILCGDMSLIGPRPERAEFSSVLEKKIPFYRYRLSVKPGLTGWAQVKYRYGNSDNDALTKLQYDLYYIKHQSFMLDIFIMLMTGIEILFCRGV